MAEIESRGAWPTVQEITGIDRAPCRFCPYDGSSCPHCKDGTCPDVDHGDCVCWSEAMWALANVEEIAARHPTGEHMCPVCDEYGCRERLSPYYGSPPSDAPCDTAVVLAALAAARQRIVELERVEAKARGLVRTAHPTDIGKHEVVRQWWDALAAALAALPERKGKG